MKCAIIYYSLSGNTAKTAKAVQKRFGADMFFIEPEKAYGAFIPSVARVVKEKLTKKEPAPKTEPADFSAYDIVFVGFPVWAGTVPQFMQNYLKACDLSGKRVIPFATARGSGKDSSLKTVKALLPGSDVTDYLFTSMIEKPDVAAWLDKIAG